MVTYFVAQLLRWNSKLAAYALAVVPLRSNRTYPFCSMVGLSRILNYSDHAVKRTDEQQVAGRGQATVAIVSPQTSAGVASMACRSSAPSRTPGITPRSLLNTPVPDPLQRLGTRPACPVQGRPSFSDLCPIAD